MYATNMKNSTISVIMSVYNNASSMEEAIESILQQTCKSLEFIIVNDGSTDKGGDILEHYKKKDARVHVITQQRRGLTHALNVGLKTAQGRYIVRQDADDISVPARIEKQIGFIEQTGHDIVGSYAHLINEKGAIVKLEKRPCQHTDIAKRLLVANCILHPTVMFNKEKILAIGGYNEEFLFSQDYELYLRGLRRGLTYGCIPEPLVKIRHRSDASSVKNRRRQLLFALSAQANYFAHQKQFSFYSVYCILTHIAKMCIPFWIRSARLWIRNRR